MDEGSKPEVLSRIAQTTAAVTKQKVICNDKNIAISSKIRPMRSLVTSIFLYAGEMSTITADIERRVQSLEIRYFRKLLGILYRDPITNEEVKTRAGNAIGPYEDLNFSEMTQTEVVRARHQIIGTGLRRGRQRKRWEDNIKEWTGLEWNCIPRKAENRKVWRKLVGKSNVVPRPKLRDRRR